MMKLSLVVVDDNLVSRLLPSLILRSLRMSSEVMECKNGAEALNLIKIHQITHVLLDISMPNESGISVAKEIRLSPKNKNICIIAYTADALAVDATYLKSVGFDAMLLKPLKREDLLHALNLTDQ